ncbi:hypothetical protein Adu01nite_37310 [Paractinoplanes durhamensis]|uniref:Uncharacterized protein n=1 Tax=Paractinoplanes durhamensis TaxID=113563 RepID=A0ABQ3YXQ9_9ACTN|nr:hypothetical protein Adu01nite_37310 [Actinoplanes durhamensis]
MPPWVTHQHKGGPARHAMNEDYGRLDRVDCANAREAMGNAAGIALPIAGGSQTICFQTTAGHLATRTARKTNTSAPPQAAHPLDPKQQVRPGRTEAGLHRSVAHGYVAARATGSRELSRQPVGPCSQMVNVDLQPGPGGRKL